VAEASTSRAAQTTSMIYRPTTRSGRAIASSSSSSSATSKSKQAKNATKKRKRKTDDTSSSDEEESDSDFTPSASNRKAVAGRARIVFCSNCTSRFIRKTDENESICPKCLSGPSKKANVPAVRKKTLPAVKKHVHSNNVVRSLQDICITVIADLIDEVESFGVISDDSFEKLAKIMSRNRRLNDQTSRLFMEPFRKQLSLYDCTNMTEDAFMMISQFCFQMQSLELIYCGRITDKVIQAYQDRLHQLRSLELSGAFMITKQAWIAFFEAVGTRLECFGLRHSARFIKVCMEALAKFCPNLQKLKFGHLAHMDSEWLADIAKLKKLHTLELAWTSDGNHFKTEDVIHMLSQIGPQLKELSIKGGHQLSDAILNDGILKYCPHLKKLSLEQCDQLTSSAMVHFLDNWEGTSRLSYLDISRCILFDDDVLKAVVRHTSDSLKHLNLHSLELLTPAGLECLAGNGDGSGSCKALTHLDCGFVRSMDDFVLHKLTQNCTALQDVQVWGCHLVSDKKLQHILHTNLYPVVD
jgi:DNA repair protein RAD7